MHSVVTHCLELFAACSHGGQIERMKWVGHVARIVK